MPRSIRHRSASCRAAGCGARLAAVACLFAAVPPSALAEESGAVEAVRATGPAFGDSNWVAPYSEVNPGGDSTEPGPRVGEPQGEPAGETLLRLPFRVALFPVKMLARGLELTAGYVGDEFVPPPSYTRRYRAFVLEPLVDISGSSGPEAGFRAHLKQFGEPRARTEFMATYSLKQHINARARQRINVPAEPFRLELEQHYRYRPNNRFYGIGNRSRDEDRSIFLEEEGRAEARLSAGPSDIRRISLVGGYSGITARKGRHDSPHLEDVFPPGAVPYYGTQTSVFQYGLGADLATGGLEQNPSLGIHLRGESRRNVSSDRFDLDYFHTQLEARAYVPVFADRRVIALRGAYEFVKPRPGSDPVPFYRLPESAKPYRFAGFSSHRFRDNYLALAHIEYRWIIWQNLWALGFAQAGEVAAHARHLKVRDAHDAFGLGLRYGGAEGTVVRLEAGRSDEGITIVLDLSGDF